MVLTDTPVFIKCTDLSHDDVAVQHTQQDPDLPQEHVSLTLGDLGYGHLQHQLHQVAFIWI